MSPLCISTSRRVIARPKPVPRLRTRSSLVCLYSSKMTARSCGLMPGPVSRTLRRAKRPSLADVDDDLTLLGELDGVADEVREHLPHALRVGARVHGDLALHVNGDGTLADEPGRLANDLASHGREVDPGARQPQLSALERAELEDVVDEIEQVLARSADLLDLFAGLGRERPVDLGHQDVGEPEDRVEGAAQLVADGREERGAVAVCGPHAREVGLVARLRRREAVDERVERDGERADLVHRADRHRLAGGLGPDVDHASHALADELDVPVGVAGHGVCHGRGHADEQHRQGDERPHERRRRLGGARLAHERDQHLRRRRSSRDQLLGPEAGAPEAGHRFSGRDGGHALERGPIRHAEARVEDHVAVAGDDDELGARLARRELHEVEPLAGREPRQARAQRRREKLRASRGVIVARGREVRDPEGADGRGDRQAYEDHDRGGERHGAARRDRCAPTPAPFEHWLWQKTTGARAAAGEPIRANFPRRHLMPRAPQMPLASQAIGLTLGVRQG